MEDVGVANITLKVENLSTINIFESNHQNLRWRDYQTTPINIQYHITTLMCIPCDYSHWIRQLILKKTIGKQISIIHYDEF